MGAVFGFLLARDGDSPAAGVPAPAVLEEEPPRDAAQPAPTSSFPDVAGLVFDSVSEADDGGVDSLLETVVPSGQAFEEGFDSSDADMGLSAEVAGDDLGPLGPAFILPAAPNTGVLTELPTVGGVNLAADYEPIFRHSYSVEAFLLPLGFQWEERGDLVDSSEPVFLFGNRVSGLSVGDGSLDCLGEALDQPVSAVSARDRSTPDGASVAVRSAEVFPAFAGVWVRDAVFPGDDGGPVVPEPIAGLEPGLESFRGPVDRASPLAVQVLSSCFSTIEFWDGLDLVGLDSLEPTASYRGTRPVYHFDLLELPGDGAALPGAGFGLGSFGHGVPVVKFRDLWLEGENHWPLEYWAGLEFDNRQLAAWGLGEFQGWRLALVLHGEIVDPGPGGLGLVSLAGS